MNMTEHTCKSQRCRWNNKKKVLHTLHTVDFRMIDEGKLPLSLYRKALQHANPPPPNPCNIHIYPPPSSSESLQQKGGGEITFCHSGKGLQITHTDRLWRALNILGGGGWFRIWLIFGRFDRTGDNYKAGMVVTEPLGIAFTKFER